MPYINHAGVPPELMIYPDHYHGKGDTLARMHLYEMMTSFLMRHLP